MNHEESGVHAHHCCKRHGCKYGNDDCPVAYGNLDQEYPCEDCRDDEFDIDKAVWEYLITKMSRFDEKDLALAKALQIEEMIRTKKISFDKVMDMIFKMFRDRIFPNYR